MTAAAPSPVSSPLRACRSHPGGVQSPAAGRILAAARSAMLSAQKASAPASSHFVILTARLGSISHRRTAGFSPVLFLGAS